MVRENEGEKEKEIITAGRTGTVRGKELHKNTGREDACSTDQRTEGLSHVPSPLLFSISWPLFLFHSQILPWPQYPVSAFTFISPSAAHVSLNTVSCYILFVFG